MSPQVAAPWPADPAGRLAHLAGVLDGYWEQAIAPSWPRVRAYLEADLGHRACALARRGPEELLADLHPRIWWRAEELSVEVRKDEVAELDGRGLLLVPTAFGTGPAVKTADPATRGSSSATNR